VIKLLAIPVAGTIAALVAILLAHPEREGAVQRPAFEPPPFHFPADEPPELPEPEQPGSEPGAAEAGEIRLRLEADGALLDVEAEKVYASAAELAKRLGATSRKLIIANGQGVGEEALDATLARLRDRYQVEKDYRAPETQPEEEEPGKEEADK